MLKINQRGKWLPVSAPMGMETVASQNRDGREVSHCLGGLFLIFFFIPWLFLFVFPTLFFLVTSQGATTLLKNNKVYRRRESSQKSPEAAGTLPREASAGLLQRSRGKQPLRQAPAQPNPHFILGPIENPGSHVHWLLFHLKSYVH